MLSKIATFRSKGSSSSQKLQQQQRERFASQNLLNTEAATSKSNGSYYSSKSWLDDKVASELSYSGSMTTDASYASTPGSYGNSSPGYFKTHFTYDGKETLTNSSTLSEDIDIGPPVLPPYEDAEEQFLEDYESYFLHLSVDNVRKDQYPKLELQRIVYLDHATCPLYSRFQLYGSLDPKQRGSILTFNVLDSTGNIFPARLLQRLAERSNIFLDFGCLCDSVMANLLHSKSDKQMGVYESALNLEVVRVSLGHVSTFDDAYRLAQFLSRFRDEDYMSYEAFDYVKELENEC